MTDGGGGGTGADVRQGWRGDPSTHQLRLFLLLAEELHFGRAARRAFLAQPSLSQQIRSLERRIGLPLVRRTTRAVALTAAGSELLPRIRAAVEAADRLRESALVHVRESRGLLAVGALEAVMAVPPIPAVMAALADRHPALEVRVDRMGFADSGERLLAGEVDAAFVFLPVPQGVQTMTVATLPRVACLPADDPLARRGPLTLDQLRDRPCVGWSPRVPEAWRRFWSCDPRPDGTPARHTGHGVTEFEPALAAIARGEGVQFPPRPAEQLYPRPGVAYVEVTDLPPCRAVLAWRGQDRDRPVVAALRQAVRDTVRRTPA